MLLPDIHALPINVDIDTSCSTGQNVVSNLVPFVDCTNGEVGVTNPITEAITEGVGDVVGGLTTFWVNTPTAPISAGTLQSGQPSPVVEFLQNSLQWYVAVLLVVGIIVGAIRLMWAQRGEPVHDLFRGLLQYIVVAGAGTSVIAILVMAADGFSGWVIENSMSGKDFGAGLLQMITGSGGLGLVLLIVFGVIAILVSITQIGILIFRGGILVLLAGVLPVLAASSLTRRGDETFQKVVGWIIAFCLYKPAASLVYAAAFKLVAVSSTDQSIGVAVINSVTGITLMFLSVLALPALIRVTLPATAAVAQGRGAGAAVTSAALIAAPTGAAALAR